MAIGKDLWRKDLPDHSNKKMQKGIQLSTRESARWNNFENIQLLGQKEPFSSIIDFQADLQYFPRLLLVAKGQLLQKEIDNCSTWKSISQQMQVS